MSAAFHAVNLLTLAAVLAAAALTFRALVRSETTQKRRRDLAYWAAHNHMRLENARRLGVPPPLDALPREALEAQWVIGDARTTLAQLHRPRGPCWNLLVRRRTGAFQAGAALRPVRGGCALLDGLGWEQFPLLLRPERFIACGQDSAAARHLAQAHLEGLLPADVALILWGSALILDFSNRPFDALELSRMTALADQIAAHLPAPFPLPAL